MLENLLTILKILENFDDDVECRRPACSGRCFLLCTMTSCREAEAITEDGEAKRWWRR